MQIAEVMNYDNLFGSSPTTAMFTDGTNLTKTQLLTARAKDTVVRTKT